MGARQLLGAGLRPIAVEIEEHRDAAGFPDGVGVLGPQHSPAAGDHRHPSRQVERRLNPAATGHDQPPASSRSTSSTIVWASTIWPSWILAVLGPRTRSTWSAGSSIGDPGSPTNATVTSPS